MEHTLHTRSCIPVDVPYLLYLLYQTIERGRTRKRKIKLNPTFLKPRLACVRRTYITPIKGWNHRRRAHRAVPLRVGGLRAHQSDGDHDLRHLPARPRRRLGNLPRAEDDHRPLGGRYVGKIVRRALSYMEMQPIFLHIHTVLEFYIHLQCAI